MLGKHHIPVHTAIGASALSLFGTGLDPGSTSIWSNYCRQSVDVLLPVEARSYLFHGMFFYGMAFCFFVLGSLLPDVDSRDSWIGQYFYLPVRHRTWTHTFWALGLFNLLWGIHAWFRWLWIGYCLHIWMDACSKAGVRWLYPLTKYKVYESGAFIAEGHKFQCYRVGRKSEKAFATRVILLCVGISFMFGVYFHGFRYLGKWMFG